MKTLIEPFAFKLFARPDDKGHGARDVSPEQFYRGDRYGSVMGALKIRDRRPAALLVPGAGGL